MTYFSVDSFRFLSLFLRIANHSLFIVCSSKITYFIAVAGIGGMVAVVVRREYFDYFKEVSLFYLEMVNSRFISCASET